MKKVKLISCVSLTLISSLALISFVPKANAEEPKIDSNKLLLKRYNTNRTVLLTVKEKIKDYENNIVLHQLGIKNFNILDSNYSNSTDSPLGTYTNFSDALSTVDSDSSLKPEVTIKYFYDNKNNKVAQEVNIKNGNDEKNIVLVYSSKGELDTVYSIK